MLFRSGHCTPNTWDLAEAIPDGETTRRVEQIAGNYGVFISVGLSEKENDIVFNTQLLIGPDGYIGKQRKIHCSRDEVLFYKGGMELWRIWTIESGTGLDGTTSW